MNLAHPNVLFLVVLFLHIGGAIVAFGPTFAFPLIGAAGAREPQHAGFAVRITASISKGLVLPVALWVGATGVLLIVVSGRSVGELWLGLAIALYVLAVGFSLFVAAPNTARLVEAVSAAPPTPAPGAAVPAGPPPYVAALVAKAQRNGSLMGVLLIAILLLMVFKPNL